MNKEHWYKGECPKYDCRKESCKCGLKKVFLAAALGDDSVGSPIAPKNGAYCNAIVYYEANGNVYLYSTEGIPTLVEKDSAQYSDFIGTDGVTPGAAGLVPAPATTDADKYLKSGGTWGAISAGGEGLVVYMDSVLPSDTPIYLFRDAERTVPITLREILDVYATGENVVFKSSSQNMYYPVVSVIDNYENDDYEIDVRDSNYQYFATFSDATNDYIEFSGGEHEISVQSDWNTTSSSDLSYIKNKPTIPTVVQTAGVSTTDVMSQDATTSALFADPGQRTKVRIGNTNTVGHNSMSIGYNADASSTFCLAVGINARAQSSNSTAIGNGSSTGSNLNSVALGYKATTTRDGEVNVGVYNTNGGYNNTPYRVIGGVYDGQDAHDAVTLEQLDGRVLQNAGAPTTATSGAVGQLLEDTTNGKLYQCTAVDTTDPDNPSYTWAEVGAGGGPTVVQTTGTSQTDVMSQNAVTSMIYNDPSAKTQVKIGNGASSNKTRSIAIGDSATASKNMATALGNGATANGERAVALGVGATTGNNYGSVALGAQSVATRAGEVNVGAGATSYGYNNTSYRIIGGVHDGQDLHDAATVAQGNTLATAAPSTSTVGVLGQLWTDTTNMHTYQCTAIDTTDPDNPVYSWAQRW